MRNPTIIAAIALLSGCYTETGVTHVDLIGTVVLPKDASVIEMSDGEDVWTIDDPRAIGPVYVGVFSGLDATLESYNHPEIGPVTEAGANTYPYGGNTVGRFDWACYEAIKCQVVTGRFKDFDDILDFFETQVRKPIINNLGDPVTSGLEFRERCYEVLYRTSDFELPFLSGNDLDFVDMGSTYEAELEILHTDYREGVALWGWMDKPSFSYTFGTCNAGLGNGVFYYELDQNFETGAGFQNLLGYPAQYIEPGDYISNEGFIVDDPNKEFTLELGFEHAD